MTETFS